MFSFFQMQAAIPMFLSIALTVPSYRPDSPNTITVAITAALWLIAVADEALTDQQLHSFIASPANRDKACRAGLWRYSRCPSYFFECIY